MKFISRIRVGTKTVALLLVMTLIAMIIPVSGAAPANVSPVDNQSDLILAEDGMRPVLTSKWLSMEVNPDSGCMNVTDQRNAMVYTSNPADYADDSLAQGITIDRMRSQLIVTYLNDNNAIDKVNSFSGCVETGGLQVYEGKDRIVLEYTFAAQGFVIPLILSLTDTAMVVSIDYNGIRENGSCQVLNINLLPYFGAARQGDDGFFIIPDGSGAYVSFNNGCGAQGAYTMNIYGSDMTIVSSNKPNDYKPVLLPVYAGIFTHVTDRLTDEIGRDVHAGYLAMIRSGAAGATLTTSISGLDSSYNISSFDFLFRSQVKASFLSRTWAEIVKIMTSSQTNVAEHPVLEYRFLNEEEASVTGAASICSESLFAQQRTEASLSRELYLDIYTGVKKKQQFLGIGYQAVSPLTTLSQTDSMLEELQKTGVDKFAVLLRGLDEDGAYYGKIDTRFTVDGKIGSFKELTALVEKWGTIYPEVSLTEFSADGKGIYSFLHSVTGIDKTTTKRFDYRYSTGLRNYERPTRYLLQPSKVSDAADRLKKYMVKKGLTTMAPNSLGQDLYGNYSGKQETVSSTMLQFKQVLATLGESHSLLLESPNAYAMSEADRLLYLPNGDSGHFISDGSIPFLQLVLDGRKSYSVPAMNYTGNMRNMLLFAIESNSAPAFSLMWEEYDLISRTTLSNLYASTYAQWKTVIAETYREWREIREKTQDSCVAEYEFISTNVRKVIFENGTEILLNYGTVPYVHDQKTVASKSYMVIGEGED